MSDDEKKGKRWEERAGEAEARRLVTLEDLLRAFRWALQVNSIGQCIDYLGPEIPGLLAALARKGAEPRGEP
jgi:hypothetical protein